MLSNVPFLSSSTTSRASMYNRIRCGLGYRIEVECHNVVPVEFEFADASLVLRRKINPPQAIAHLVYRNAVDVLVPLGSFGLFLIIVIIVFFFVPIVVIVLFFMPIIVVIIL